MTLGIAFKGPEGIVLAVDSRVTLTAQAPGQNMLIPATFDNATKMLSVSDQKYVGAITYGNGAIGQREPRTAHSFLPEFEDDLSKENPGRLSVNDFASRLGVFFMNQWRLSMPENYQGPDMNFLIGGYDAGAPYGRLFEVKIPSNPVPLEYNQEGQFGVIWGGQRELTDRLIMGYDPGVPYFLQQQLNLTDQRRNEIQDSLRRTFTIPIPFQFLPLQDCVDLAMTLIRTTMAFQTWMVGVRGVGGAIDIATITRTDGFVPIQRKTITATQMRI
jgi:hypothetical protein